MQVEDDLAKAAVIGAEGGFEHRCVPLQDKILETAGSGEDSALLLLIPAALPMSTSSRARSAPSSFRASAAMVTVPLTSTCASWCNAAEVVEGMSKTVSGA